MNPIILKLHEHIVPNPPCYGDNDAHSVLEMLYCYYRECNVTDNDAVTAAFDELYCKMHGMTLSASSVENTKRRDLWKVSRLVLAQNQK